MARSTLIRTHQRDLAIVTNQAAQDLGVLWRDGFKSADTARDLLLRGLPQLTEFYGSAAATLGADFYDNLRDAAKVKGSFRAMPARPVTGEALDVLARVAVGPLFQANPDPAAAFSLARGGLQRHIANADRQTVREASIEDPGSQGWTRVGFGECDWCQQFIDGEVHFTEGYDFDAHDHCGCTAVSVFNGQRASDLMRDLPEIERPEVLRGFDALSRDKVEKQIAILEPLKDSDYRTTQLAKLRARLDVLS